MEFIKELIINYYYRLERKKGLEHPKCLINCKNSTNFHRPANSTLN